MRTVTKSRAQWIMTIKPDAKIETRDGTDVLLIPEYNFDNDTTSWIERRITPDSDGPQPGDTLRHETGAKFKIADLPSVLFGKVVKRETPEDDSSGAL